MDNSILINSVDDMGRLLQSVCHDKAVDFARAQHERACWGYDGQRVTFWQDVMASLAAQHGDGQATARALNAPGLRSTHKHGAAVQTAVVRHVA